MSIISKAIGNLFNGVSQQSPALRLPSQAELQVNCESSPVEGLHRRAPTRHIARLFASPLDKPLVHTINRDKTERYQVVCTGDDLKVFDLLTGAERPVTFSASKDYLKTSNPRDGLKALTVEDYTFFLNKSVKPAMATTPYLSTDQVGVSINFGSGELTGSAAWPLPQYSRFRYAYQNGFISGGEALWNTSPGSPGPYETFDQAYAALFANLDANGYEYPNQALVSWEIAPDVGNPAYADGTGEYESYMLGIKATPKSPLMIAHPSVNGGVAFDCKVMLLYSKTTSGGAPVTALESLRGDVGWPATPYHIPGEPYEEHSFGMTDGTIFVSVNGTTFSKAADPTWNAEQYVDYFRGLIEAAFPSLDVTVNDGWQLNIEAPAGQRVYVRAWDSEERGYVQTSYRNLPIQEALFVVIKMGLPDQTYSVSINGSEVTHKASAADVPDGHTTEAIAQALTTKFNLVAGLQAANYGSFIKVIHTSGTPITYAWRDSYGNSAMYAMKNRVQKVSDLPANFVPGHPLEVAGPDGGEGYYVHYVIDGAKPAKAYGIDRQVTFPRLNLVVQPAGSTWNAIEGLETGCWEECAKPGVPDVLIPDSMPHVLVSKADGSFEFKTMDWFKRSAGDEDSVPAPSFVGKNVVDLLFTRNRFALMCAESIVFSRAGQFFNFWAETAKDVLDSDPIDVLVNHHKVATLRHSAVFNSATILFSDSTQFVVSARELLSPRTVNIQPATEYQCSPVCKPVSLGASVFFVNEAGGHTSTWQYLVDTQANQNVAANITAHVPKYLPPEVFKLAGSVELNRLVALAGGESLFVYRYLDGPEGKLQESWSEWTMGGQVLGAEFIESTLYLTMGRADGVFLESLDLKDGATEEALPFLVHLDRKVSLTVSGGAVTVPYDAEVTFVSAATGAVVPAVRGAGNSWTLDHAGDVFAGIPYESRYRFSPLFMKDDQRLAIQDGRLTVKNFSLAYAKTCQFDVEVQPKGRAARRYRFESVVTGENLLGDIAPADGSYRFLVMGEGHTTRIEIVSSSHLPFHFQSATWEADFTVRTRRV